MGPLDEAVVTVYQSGQGVSTRPHTAHDILRANLPLYPICGRFKSDHQRMAATMAILLPYLQLSSKARVKGRAYYRLTSIPLDIDGRHWHAHDFRDRDIPVPDIIIRNPDKPSTHAVWVLPFPVWMPVGAKPRPFATDRQPWELYLAVEAWLVAATGADRPLRALKVKNPWSTEHDVEWTHNGHVRGLDELIQWVPATKPEPVQEDSGEGRNATLFRRALLAVTGIARRVGQAVDDLTDALYQVGDVLNVFPEPLPVGEVRSTLRSVARYASQWTIRAEATKGWVVSKGLEPEEIRLRQSASASRTNGMRKDKTLTELTRVARLMIADGVEVTKAGLARASGMARVTVQRAWDRLSTALLNTGPSTGEGCEVMTMEQVEGATAGESAPVEAVSPPAQCPVSEGLKDPASGSDPMSENFAANAATKHQRGWNDMTTAHTVIQCSVSARLESRRRIMTSELIEITGDTKLSFEIMAIADLIAATQCKDWETVASEIFFSVKCMIGNGERVRVSALFFEDTRYEAEMRKYLQIWRRS